MRKKQFLSVLLLVSMATGTIFNPGGLKASDTLPYLGDSARGENQAYQHGYRALDIESWSPETDPYAEYLRAQVPLQNRNEAFSATQANPGISPKTQMLTLAGDYGNAFFDSYPYTNEFSQYLFNFWQYTDYYASWHGMPTEEVPESLYLDERGVTDAWKQRKFEFGIINLPNPGYTNAAHKNGVLSLGCIFTPRTGQDHKPLLKQDGSGHFIVADKLVEMCRYYGFDGFFINQEESIPSADIPLYRQFMKQLRDAGLYIQWYDSVVDSGYVSYQNEFNAKNSSNVISEDGKTRYSDSIFLNYWWNKTKLTNSAARATALGLDPLNTVFAGIEAGGDRWSQTYDLRNNLGDDGQPMNAIASLGSEFVHDGLDEDLDGGENNNIAMRREKDNYQWMTFDRERAWWSGLNMDPAKVVRDTSLANSQIGIDSGNSWDGISAYITERSVINGDTFVTNFNTGHGLEYAVNGAVSNSHEWSNINIQDILPTWQWWVDTQGTRLNVDYDYGTKYSKTLKDGSEGIFNFELAGAYNGGSSLVVSGKLDSENFVHLYKTDLDVKAGSRMDVTFNKTSEDTAAMHLGIIFKDDTSKTVKLDVVDSTAKSNGWITSQVDLSQYAGRKIAAFGLIFNGTSDKYQMNIGQIKITAGPAQKPAAPTGLKIDRAYDTKEMKLSWDIDPYSQVKQYNIYAVINGTELYMGGIYDSVYYIKSLYNAQDIVTVKVKAVSADGTESDAAEAAYDYSKAVKNVNTVAEALPSVDIGSVIQAVTGSMIKVNWTAPEGVEIDHTDIVVTREYANDDTPYAAAVTGDSNSAVIEIPEVKGTRYNMKITPVGIDGHQLSAVTYDGRMADVYSEPYTGKVSGGKLTIPLSKDWWKIYYTVITGGVSGKSQTVERSVNAMPAISTAADGVKVILEDYSGNYSIEVFVEND